MFVVRVGKLGEATGLNWNFDGSAQPGFIRWGLITGKHFGKYSFIKWGLITGKHFGKYSCGMGSIASY